MWALVALVLCVFFLILLFRQTTPERVWTSGTGPGFIPAFQGHPSVGVSGA
jgi:hypothetical protein